MDSTEATGKGVAVPGPVRSARRSDGPVAIDAKMRDFWAARA